MELTSSPHELNALSGSARSARSRPPARPAPRPARVSRATVAAAMLDEAENPARAGTIAIPLER
jgi:hypothetical protein